MMVHKNLASILILSSFISLSYCGCKVPLYFSSKNNALYCKDIHFNNQTQLIKEFPIREEKYNALHITESYIPEIYNETFEGLEHFEHVILSNITLRKIEPNLFVNWKNLTELNLAYNKLTSVDFHLPLSIRELNISHNKINNIKELQNYTNLLMLDLSYNSLVSIIDFRQFSFLQYLDLSHNNISGLENFSWLSSRELKLLNLNHNYIEFKHEIVELTYVEDLDLSYNNISYFDCKIVKKRINFSNNDFTGLCNFSRTIEEIDFSQNEINDIYEYTFKNLNKLSYLNLSSNYIRTINFGIFNDLTNLKILDLSDNIIHELPTGLFIHLTNLETLFMASNYIQNFKHGTFTGLNNHLRVLNVNNNEIENLDVIYSLRSLRELYINDNYFYDLDTAQIIQHLPKLSKISFNLQVTCEELMLYILMFKNALITVEKGDVNYSKHVNGIFCNTDPNIKIKQESDERRIVYIGNYLSRMSIALIVILVFLIFVIMLTSYTLYREHMKHRRQKEIDRNLHTCSLKLLSENDPLN